MSADVDVLSFGCRLNAAEAAGMQALASPRLLRPTVIVNTCAVTAAARFAAYGARGQGSTSW